MFVAVATVHILHPLRALTVKQPSNGLTSSLEFQFDEGNFPRVSGRYHYRVLGHAGARASSEMTNIMLAAGSFSILASDDQRLADSLGPLKLDGFSLLLKEFLNTRNAGQIGPQSTRQGREVASVLCGLVVANPQQSALADQVRVLLNEAVEASPALVGQYTWMHWSLMKRKEQYLPVEATLEVMLTEVLLELVTAKIEAIAYYGVSLALATRHIGDGWFHDGWLSRRASFVREDTAEHLLERIDRRSIDLRLFDSEV